MTVLKTPRSVILPTPPGDKETTKNWRRGLIRELRELRSSVRSDMESLEVRSGLPVYANNAAALADNLAVGEFYRTGGDPDTICVVHE